MAQYTRGSEGTRENQYIPVIPGTDTSAPPAIERETDSHDFSTPLTGEATEVPSEVPSQQDYIYGQAVAFDWDGEPNYEQTQALLGSDVIITTTESLGMEALPPGQMRVYSGTIWEEGDDIELRLERFGSGDTDPASVDHDYDPENPPPPQMPRASDNTPITPLQALAKAALHTAPYEEQQLRNNPKKGCNKESAKRVFQGGMIGVLVVGNLVLFIMPPIDTIEALEWSKGWLVYFAPTGLGVNALFGAFLGISFFYLGNVPPSAQDAIGETAKWKTVVRIVGYAIAPIVALTSALNTEGIPFFGEPLLTTSTWIFRVLNEIANIFGYLYAANVVIRLITWSQRTLGSFECIRNRSLALASLNAQFRLKDALKVPFLEQQRRLSDREIMPTTLTLASVHTGTLDFWHDLRRDMRVYQAPTRTERWLNNFNWLPNGVGTLLVWSGLAGYLFGTWAGFFSFPEFISWFSESRYLLGPLGISMMFLYLGSFGLDTFSAGYSMIKDLALGRFRFAWYARMKPKATAAGYAIGTGLASGSFLTAYWLLLKFSPYVPDTPTYYGEWLVDGLTYPTVLAMIVANSFAATGVIKYMLKRSAINDKDNNVSNKAIVMNGYDNLNEWIDKMSPAHTYQSVASLDAHQKVDLVRKSVDPNCEMSEEECAAMIDQLLHTLAQGLQLAQPLREVVVEGPTEVPRPAPPTTEHAGVVHELARQRGYLSYQGDHRQLPHAPTHGTINLGEEEATEMTRLVTPQVDRPESLQSDEILEELQEQAQHQGSIWGNCGIL